MRDRLVDLIHQADKECSTRPNCKGCNSYGLGGDCYNYLIADSILADGWVRLPCKVGDKLYGFEYPRRDIVVINEETVEDVHIEIETNEGWYPISEVGKRVLLTKEEAEQKLNEMRVENGNL